MPIRRTVPTKITDYDEYRVSSSVLVTPLDSESKREALGMMRFCAGNDRRDVRRNHRLLGRKRHPDKLRDDCVINRKDCEREAKGIANARELLMSRR